MCARFWETPFADVCAPLCATMLIKFSIFSNIARREMAFPVFNSFACLVEQKKQQQQEQQKKKKNINIMIVKHCAPMWWSLAFSTSSSSSCTASSRASTLFSDCCSICGAPWQTFAMPCAYYNHGFEVYGTFQALEVYLYPWTYADFFYIALTLNTPNLIKISFITNELYKIYME